MFFNNSRHSPHLPFAKTKTFWFFRLPTFDDSSPLSRRCLNETFSLSVICSLVDWFYNANLNKLLIQFKKLSKYSAEKKQIKLLLQHNRHLSELRMEKAQVAMQAFLELLSLAAPFVWRLRVDWETPRVGLLKGLYAVRKNNHLRKFSF